ncbi:MAG: phage recombination protein Bet [Mesorhizobium sp.]|uniref:phage recombination protein Bet n=1 Tax=Mesorhizobium sp. TaxID=1871066 RepID=UPI00121A2B26|nr:phage recombination protein Bet [Mesorhizobium sp.]TIV83841.1 MAG: phage recombination protein Bet [Mesorhizobium sp.]
MNAPVPAGSALIAFEQSRLPITSQFAEKLQVSAGQWRVLVDQIFPNARTVEAVTMALSYCKSRNLDIFKRVVHIVPMWSAALNREVETCWPGIAEIRTTAARTGEYAGIDEVVFGPTIEREFTGQVGRRGQERQITKKVKFPEWASVVVYRMVQGVRCAFHTKIFWEETYASIGKSEVPNDMWAKRPRGQFDKCVEAAALRKAFPEELGNTYAAEEMEGRTIEHSAADIPTPPKPPRPDTVKPTSAPPKPNGSAQPAGEPAKPPKPASPEQSELAGMDVEEAVIDDEIPNFDRDTGEIPDEGDDGEGNVDESEEQQLTPTDMLTLLDDAMATKSTEADVLELWNEHDLPARLTHVEKGEEFVAISKAIRDKHLKRVRAK